MSELTFEQMLDESFKTIRTGEIVSGEVIDVKPDYIILNIGYKSDGILSKAEYTNDLSIDLTEKVKTNLTLRYLRSTTEKVRYHLRTRDL